MRLSTTAFPVAGIVFLAGCSAQPAPAPAGGGTAAAPASASAAAAAPSPATTSPLDRFAVEYVKLVLAMGEHDPGYVDAYYGPPEWQQEVKAAPPELPAIRERAERLLGDLSQLPAPAEEMTALRHRFLRRQTEALLGRLDMLQGKKLRFDDESRVLYDAVAPHHDEAHYQALVAELDKLVPGDGAVYERVDAFRAASPSRATSSTPSSAPPSTSAARAPPRSLPSGSGAAAG